MATSTDKAGPHKWLLHDEVTHLRRWASEASYPLPSTPLAKGETRMIGAAEGCWLRLQDAEGRVSRRHAQLTYERPDGWLLGDLASKNGLWLDGETRASPFPLTPGIEIRIGGITMIAESPRLRVLREVLERLLGWSTERREEVDLALRSIRMAVMHREPLLLCAENANISIARLLHQHTIGPDRPLIVCDPRRVGKPEETARAAPNYKRGLEALDAATGGTLCVWRWRLPPDFPEVEELRRKPDARVLLVVCSTSAPHLVDTESQLVIPSLSERGSELHRIVAAYGADAVAEFGGKFTPDDLDWIAEYESSTLAAIETATRRLVAYDACGEEVSRAANQLGMSHGSLSVWIARRRMPQGKQRRGQRR
ncbi:MAG TPA: FHA domain-containing protein [Kofleriaceae bacterium]|jgi:hypothetical protein|nr:FHA domain-containing protein [Kofleriaceae bacterium]